MEKTWEYVWNRLFDERTCMFYNYLVGHAPDAATAYLPKPELIGLVIPNPGGYGTGMEDCMINAGLMMDGVVARYEVTGDEQMREYAAKIYRGMELCATVSHKKGFLPRGVSPADCRSHYTDTSRDQYTNWFYAAHRLYYSPLANETQKASIRRILTAMAEKMETEVIPENHWNFLREDGEIGLVGQMWGDVAPHEFFRLPMLYLLTWKTTGDEHWHDMYMRYRDEAIAGTLKFVPLSGATYVGLQLQYSVRLVYDLDEDPAVREICLKFMQTMTKPYEDMIVDWVNRLMTPQGTEWLEIQYGNWETSRFRYAGCKGGKGYFIPEPSNFREHQTYYPLRAVGEGISVAALCPGWRISDRSLDLLCRMADFVNYDKHCTCAPIALIEAYWLARKSRL
ncbi:MAG: hypothetical protein IJ325_09815 [Clostridia bacterium]|nr:hypothetical protein [Clostridia bacterium]